MKVELLENVMHGNQLRVDSPREEVLKRQKNEDGTETMVVARNARRPIVWEKGAIIECSETTGKKFISRGIAKAVEAVKS